MPKGTDLTSDQRLEIVKLYQSGTPVKDIIHQLNLHVNTIYRQLRRANIHGAQQHPKPFDAAIFDPAQESGAYWIGFFTADGHIDKSGQFRLKLSLNDIEHLQAFVKFIGIDRKIDTGVSPARPGFCAETSYCRIWFSNHALKDAFFSLGIARLKTDRNPVRMLAENRHFWRGVIDADGWLGDTGPTAPRITLTSTETICNGLLTFAESHFTELKSLTRFKGTGAYQVGQKQNHRVEFVLQKAHKLIDVLYADSHVYLPRKKLIADRILAAK